MGNQTGAVMTIAEYVAATALIAFDCVGRVGAGIAGKLSRAILPLLWSRRFQFLCAASAQFGHKTQLSFGVRLALHGSRSAGAVHIPFRQRQSPADRA